MKLKSLATSLSLAVLCCTTAQADRLASEHPALDPTAPRSIIVGIGEAGYPLSNDNHKTNVVEGILPDITREVFQQLGYEHVQIRSMPYHRLSTAIVKGDIHAANLLGIHQEIFQNKAGTASCTDSPILNMPFSIHAIDKTITDHPRIGHLMPSATSTMKPYMDKLEIYGYSEHFLKQADKLYKSLVGHRIDLAVSSDLLANYWGNQLNTRFNKVVQLGEVNFYLCFSPERFNPNQIHQLKSDFLVVIPSVNVNMITHAHGALPMISGPIPPSPTGNSDLEFSNQLSAPQTN